MCRREHWALELGDILTLCDTVVANILCRRILSGVLSSRGQDDLHIFTNTNPASRDFLESIQWSVTGCSMNKG